MENAEKTSSERVLTNSKKDGKLKKICFDLFKLKLQEQQAKEQYAKTQAELKKYFSGTKEKSLSFVVGEKGYKVTDVNPTKIIWNVEKLLERFKKRKKSKEITQQVIKKSYSISDWEGFVKLLSDNGLKADDVKPFISVESKVDQKKMDNLSEIGEITTEDIEGCYTVEETNGYIKLTDWEMKDDKEQS